MDKNDSRPLLTVADVAAWERRIAIIGSQIEELESERRDLLNLVKMANHLTKRVSREPALRLPIASLAEPKFPSAFSNAVPDEPFIAEDSSFPDAVLAIVSRRPSGVTMAQLKSELEASPLGSRLRQSDKGFYHATSRLRAEERGAPIVEYRGYLFTRDNLSTFQERVKAGVERDKPETASGRRGSPMIDAILTIVAANPGIIGKDIVDQLRKRGLLTNENSAFNAILRMRNREELIGGGPGDRGIHLGPNAPSLPEGDSYANNTDHSENNSGASSEAMKFDL